MSTLSHEQERALVVERLEHPELSLAEPRLPQAVVEVPDDRPVGP